MGILENLRYGKKARELGLTVEQYLQYQQVRETDDVTLGEYKRYLNDYAERMSWRAYVRSVLRPAQERTAALQQARPAVQRAPEPVPASAVPVRAEAVSSAQTVNTEQPAPARRRRRTRTENEQPAMPPEQTVSAAEPRPADAPILQPAVYERAGEPKQPERSDAFTSAVPMTAEERLAAAERWLRDVQMRSDDVSHEEITALGEEINAVISEGTGVDYASISRKTALASRYAQLVSARVKRITERYRQNSNPENAAKPAASVVKPEARKPEAVKPVAPAVKPEARKPEAAKPAAPAVKPVARKTEAPKPAAVSPAETTADKAARQTTGNARADRLFAKLDEAYPDRNIAGFRAQHKKWGESAGQLAKEMGYESGDAFLTAHGYTTGPKNLGGRPTKDHNAVIDELRRRYPEGTRVKSLAALVKENPDLESRLKTLTNSAKKLYGKPLWDYLVETGVIIGDMRGERNTLSSDDKADLTQQGQAILEELRKRYADAPAVMSVMSFREDHPEIDWKTLHLYQSKCTAHNGMETLLIAEGVLQKPMSQKEAAQYVVSELRARLGGKPFFGSYQRLREAHPDLPFSRIASAKRLLADAGILIQNEEEKTEPVVLADEPLLMPQTAAPDALAFEDRFFVLMVSRSKWKEYYRILQAKGAIVRFTLNYLADYIIVDDRGIPEGLIKRLEALGRYGVTFTVMTESDFNTLLDQEGCK